MEKKIERETETKQIRQMKYDHQALVHGQLSLVKLEFSFLSISDSPHSYNPKNFSVTKKKEKRKRKRKLE